MIRSARRAFQEQCPVCLPYNNETNFTRAWLFKLLPPYSKPGSHHCSLRTPPWPVGGNQAQTDINRVLKDSAALSRTHLGIGTEHRHSSGRATAGGQRHVATAHAALGPVCSGCGSQKGCIASPSAGRQPPRGGAATRATRALALSVRCWCACGRRYEAQLAAALASPTRAARFDQTCPSRGRRRRPPGYGAIYDRVRSGLPLNNTPNFSPHHPWPRRGPRRRGQHRLIGSSAAFQQPPPAGVVVGSSSSS
eukprot:scaffold420_cov404-Prasinococcus_capsulatus_cf.AAC.9